MQAAQSVVRAPAGDGGVVTRQFGAETLLVPVCGGVGDLDSVYTLNSIGTFVWNAIAQPISLERLADLVASEYDVDRERAGADIDAFLEELSQLGLIQVTGAGRPLAGSAEGGR
jgi:2-keto-3-deoxy-L-rhamnonate aldolase RhmA